MTKRSCFLVLFAVVMMVTPVLYGQSNEDVSGLKNDLARVQEQLKQSDRRNSKELKALNESAMQIRQQLAKAQQDAIEREKAQQAIAQQQRTEQQAAAKAAAVEQRRFQIKMSAGIALVVLFAVGIVLCGVRVSRVREGQYTPPLTVSKEQNSLSNSLLINPGVVTIRKVAQENNSLRVPFILRLTEGEKLCMAVFNSAENVLTEYPWVYFPGETDPIGWRDAKRHAATILGNNAGAHSNVSAPQTLQ